MEMKTVSGDEAFFYMHNNKGELMGICILHVDDFLIAGNQEFHLKVGKQLCNRFTFGKIETENFKFTGIEIEQEHGDINIGQNEFVQSLKPISIDRVGNKNNKLTNEEFKKGYQIFRKSR